MTMKQNELFTTADLALATVISLSFPIKYIDRSDNTRVEFTFENSPELNVLVEAFWQNEISLEPKLFYNQLRIVKARIYDKR